MAKGDPLLQPFQLKHLTLRNRILSTSHEPAYSVDGMPKDRYRQYHVEKARGGVALTMTAGSAIVAEDSPPAFGNLHAYKDEIVPWLKQLADECHEYDTAVMIQLTHLGRRTNWNKGDWLPVLAPSPIREPAHRAFPKQAEEWDIARIVKGYAAAAERMKAAGLDGIEIEAYGHLMDQFWSPATNQRKDEYGGSLDNRLRFSFQVLSAIRDAVGPDFIVGLRMVADEQWDKGITQKEGVEIAQRITNSKLVDFLNIIRGHIDTDAALVKVIPTHGMPSAPHLEFASCIREATKIPVFHAARINDVATARYAIAEDKLDMVGMTRALMADPYIVQKISLGNEEQIRPCVGAAYCLDRLYEGGEALCIHNAATGREASMPHIIKPTNGDKHTAVVVGAGPAGLEAARVLAERGHQVTVLEAAPVAGGQVKLASLNQRRAELIGIIDWRLAQCEKLGVVFKFNTFAEVSDVLAFDPTLVIVATGGMPTNAGLEFGADLAVSSWDILSGDIKPTGNVLLFDDNGGHPGMHAAEVIVKAGCRLEVVTPGRFFAPDVGGLSHVAYAESLQQHNAVITINRRLIGIKRQGEQLTAYLGSDYSENTLERCIDTIVVEQGTLPLDDIYFELKELSTNLGEVDYQALIKNNPQVLQKNEHGKFKLYRIGDAVASRNIHAAIYDALRLCNTF